jgi:hypothetical protein
MSHTGPLPPIWDLLDLQPSVETIHLLSLVEFTDLLNGCASDALVRNAFVSLRVVATARYLHLKSQDLHEALREAHVTIGEEVDERVRLQEEIPASDARDKTITLLAAMSTQHQEAQAAAAFNAERAVRLDWSSRISLGPAALVQAHAQVADLDDQLKARSNQQATSLTTAA